MFKSYLKRGFVMGLFVAGWSGFNPGFGAIQCCGMRGVAVFASEFRT